MRGALNDLAKEALREIKEGKVRFYHPPSVVILHPEDLKRIKRTMKKLGIDNA